jgi:hypothetical protein
MHGSLKLGIAFALCFAVQHARGQQATVKNDTLADRLGSAKYVSLALFANGVPAFELTVLSPGQYRIESEKRLDEEQLSANRIRLSQELRETSSTDVDKQNQLRQELSKLTFARNRRTPYQVVAVRHDYIELSLSDDDESVVLIPLHQIVRVRMAKATSASDTRAPR